LLRAGTWFARSEFARQRGTARICPPSASVLRPEKAKKGAERRRRPTLEFYRTGEDSREMPIECRRSRGISRRGVPIPQRSALGGRAPLQGAAYCDGGIGNLGRFACSRPWLLTDVTRPRENDVVTVAAHRPRAHKSIGMAGPSQSQRLLLSLVGSCKIFSKS
jgi:hypothetical protein